MPRPILQIANPYDIANISKKYFFSVVDTAKESIKYYHKHFSDYLNNQCNFNCMFLSCHIHVSE